MKASQAYADSCTNNKIENKFIKINNDLGLMPVIRNINLLGYY
jgi:hypothetical protein